jgi:hypothetical protein
MVFADWRLLPNGGWRSASFSTEHDEENMSLPITFQEYDAIGIPCTFQKKKLYFHRSLLSFKPPEITAIKATTYI